MRAGFEFRFHRVTVDQGDAHPDATLSLLGSQGWRLVGIAPLDDGIVCALERSLDAQAVLPDAPTLSAALVEPLSVPPEGLLEE